MSVKNLQNSDFPFHFLLKDFYKPLFGSSVATFQLAYSKISLPVSEKKLEMSGKRLDIIQFGKWRNNFSSALCFVL